MKALRWLIPSTALALAAALAPAPIAIAGPSETASGEAAHEPSPYVDFQSRSIKALSAERLEGYLEGSGMGFALAAELNRYPGPKHVIELAGSLDLTSDQIAATRRAFDVMHAQAVELGERVVAAERRLDGEFAAGTLTESDLESLTAEIGDLESRLRFAHLRAHLEMRQVLTAAQIERYVELRGYTNGESHGDPANCPHGSP